MITNNQNPCAVDLYMSAIEPEKYIWPNSVCYYYFIDQQFATIPQPQSKIKTNTESNQILSIDNQSNILDILNNLHKTVLVDASIYDIELIFHSNGLHYTINQEYYFISNAILS